MSKDDENRLISMLADYDVSEVINLLMKGNNRYNRRILKFFQWFCKWIPISLMVIHGAAMLDFSKNHYDMFKPYDDNWLSYVFTYVMLYILPMVLILASRFFYLCWRYRIPFFYFFGVNAIHIGYGSWYTTNEMAMGHRCLIIMVVGFYLYGFIDYFCLKTKLGRRICR